MNMKKNDIRWWVVLGVVLVVYNVLAFALPFPKWQKHCVRQAPGHSKTKIPNTQCGHGFCASASLARNLPPQETSLPGTSEGTQLSGTAEPPLEGIRLNALPQTA